MTAEQMHYLILGRQQYSNELYKLYFETLNEKEAFEKCRSLNESGDGNHYKVETWFRKAKKNAYQN
jgi:hypothetical protein